MNNLIDKKNKNCKFNRLNLTIRLTNCAWFISISGIIFLIQIHQYIYFIPSILAILMVVLAIRIDYKFYNQWSKKNFGWHIFSLIVITLGTLAVLFIKYIKIF